MLTGILFLIVAAWAGYGIYALVRSERQSRLYLETRNDEPLKLDHLSHPLRRLVEDTRLLRVSLESPIREIGDYVDKDFGHNAAEDLDAFDNMLMDVTRQLDEWIRTVESLSESDRAVMSDRGLGPQAIRATLEREGGAFERRNMLDFDGRGGPTMDLRLKAVADELRKVEDGLQAAQRVYR